MKTGYTVDYRADKSGAFLVAHGARESIVRFDMPLFAEADPFKRRKQMRIFVGVVVVALLCSTFVWFLLVTMQTHKHM